MKVRVHVWVSGIVQGVFFRAHTKDLALKLGVNGWIKNLPDNRVEAVFEGEEEKVKEMIDFCKKGPSRARVDKIEIKKEKYKGEFNGFEIKY